MKIIIDNNIEIQDAPQIAKDFAKNRLIVPNPKFEDARRMGYSTWGMDRELRFFWEKGNSLMLPFGCLQSVWEMFPYKDIYEYKIDKIEPLDYISEIELYDYQEHALESCIKAKNGILVMPAGSGKTQTGIELIARLKGRALWITHTKDLLNQSKKRAEMMIPNADIGEITSGKIHIGEHITFATVQTLHKMDLNIRKLDRYWDVVVVDECHRICGTPSNAGMFYKVIDSISARHKYGLTATPYRAAKGTELAMFGLLGNTITEIPDSQVKKLKAEVYPLYTSFDIKSDMLKADGTIDYTKMIGYMCEDEERNTIISEAIKSLIEQEKSVLVLSDRVGHLNTLKTICGDGRVLYGKTPKDLRSEMLEDMRQGKSDLLFSTYALAKEGLDIPRLNAIVFATPKKDKTTIVQSIGRVERVIAGKPIPIAYDVVDKHGYFQRLFANRKRIYKSNNNKIIGESE